MTTHADRIFLACLLLAAVILSHGCASWFADSAHQTAAAIAGRLREEANHTAPPAGSHLGWLNVLGSVLLAAAVLSFGLRFVLPIPLPWTLGLAAAGVGSFVVANLVGAFFAHFWPILITAGTVTAADVFLHNHRAKRAGGAA